MKQQQSPQQQPPQPPQQTADTSHGYDEDDGELYENFQANSQQSTVSPGLQGLNYFTRTTRFQ